MDEWLEEATQDRNAKDSVVYVFQDPPPYMKNGRAVPRDTSALQRYGRISYVLERDDHPHAWPSQCVINAMRSLKYFRPDVDYLCYVGGDSMAPAIALLAVNKLGHKEVTLLRYDRKPRHERGTNTTGGNYVPVKFKLP
jgi:hypothetical protein